MTLSGESEVNTVSVHPDFYPATDRTHWAPLERVAPDLIGEFMFMKADTAGRFYFRNSMTRDYVILDEQGQAYDHDGHIVPAREAIEQACGL